MCWWTRASSSFPKNKTQDQFQILPSVLGKVSKTPVTEIVREGGGGVPPLSVNFFPLGFLEPTVREGGGEYPPFPLRKNPLKIGPKTVFFGKKHRFRRKKFIFGHRPSVKGGGSTPPFR